MLEALAGLGIFYLIYLMFYGMFMLLWYAAVVAFYVIVAIGVVVVAGIGWLYETIEAKWTRRAV